MGAGPSHTHTLQPSDLSFGSPLMRHFQSAREIERPKSLAIKSPNSRDTSLPAACPISKPAPTAPIPTDTTNTITPRMSLRFMPSYFAR
jgi:hypothetical protein